MTGHMEIGRKALLRACESAAYYATKNAEACAKAVELFTKVYDKEPGEDGPFMAWIHYAETPADLSKLGEE